jgi:hypothetical protein
LVTRGVPCLRRATSLAYTDADEDAERLLDLGDGTAAEGDEWVETHTGRVSDNNPAQIDDIPDADDDDDHALSGKMADMGLGKHGADGGGTAIGEIPDMDEIPDMEEDFEEAEDEAARKPAGSNIIDSAEVEVAKGNLLQVRTYDVMITYDKYYQTPRIWLVGYDEVQAHYFRSVIIITQTLHLSLPESVTIDSASDLPRRLCRTRFQNGHHRAIPALGFPPSCVCASMQARQRDEEGH